MSAPAAPMRSLILAAFLGSDVEVTAGIEGIFGSEITPAMTYKMAIYGGSGKEI